MYRILFFFLDSAPSLVYVIGPHAVQFGNNWMRKIQKTSKLDGAIGRVQFGSLRNCLNPIIYKLDMHVDVLLPINNYIASILLYPRCMKLAKKSSSLCSGISSSFFTSLSLADHWPNTLIQIFLLL